MQKGQTLIIILVGMILMIVLGIGVFYLGRITVPKPESVNPVITSFTSPMPSLQPISTSAVTPSPQPSLPVLDPQAQECEVCGSKGIHNIDGRQCAQGLECKNREEGVFTDAYFCIKPGNSIKTCLP